MKPDYSEYLKRDGMLDFIDERWLASSWLHDGHAECVKRAMARVSPASIVEFGCGTGLLASRIDHGDYTMIDANRGCLDRAMGRNPGKRAMYCDLRALPDSLPTFDLGVCFGVLKHFGIEEWHGLLGILLSSCKWLVFDMPVDADQAEMLRDDGTEFPHVWANPAQLIAWMEKRGLAVEIDESMADRTREFVFFVGPGAGSKL